MNDDFILPLNGLAQGRSVFRRSAGKEFFELFENSEILDADLETEIVVEKAGRSIWIDGSIAGTVTVTCDRCLEDLEMPVEAGFKLSVKFGSPASGAEEEGDREVVFVGDAETDLDLGQTVYDYVCLSLPVQRVHDEGGCNPDALRYLSSEEAEGTVQKDSSTPFAGLKDLLGKIDDKI